jgi:hypothetical protein
VALASCGETEVACSAAEALSFVVESESADVDARPVGEADSDMSHVTTAGAANRTKSTARGPHLARFVAVLARAQSCAPISVLFC